MHSYHFSTMTPKLSVIIPSRNEERYIAQCLNSLLEMTYPKESVEILVVDGMSEDATRHIVTGYCDKYPFIHLLDNPKKITPTALNTGITASSGEFIIILSAHADYPKEYCLRLVEEAIRLDAGCVGGVMRTKSSKTDATSQSIINVLSDRLGTASQFRSGADKIMEVDTVAFGCYPRDIFNRFGLFDEYLVRNQDIEFNKRIVRGGGKIYLIPSVECSYYARETYRELATNNFLNGYWNILTPFYAGSLRSLSLRHFIPLSFMLSLFIPLFLSVLDFHFLWISVGLLFFYLSIISVRSYKIKKNTTWLHQIAAFIVLHFSYGIGGIKGIIALIKKILFRDTQ
ncbi:glycosyltransferase family 2 protein [Sulfuricurvum sp.]|uniref:glycosyltransferase family 2 protein n=1 Tax=Sulfuricurvum sp. TaxID=2025608 RepID=UPI002D4F9024|nr:glycosyltransferase family 2 protein [Sulfuricurvum sp.]HZF70591.1 glycosyltransferase family 2 protein [Sulfuricurvum sp.]